MDSWPSDCRKNIPNTIAKKRHQAIETFSYPLLTYNAPKFVTLTEKGGRYQWTSVFKEAKSNTLRAGQNRVAFPPTYPLPLASARMSIKQRTKHEANFMRSYFPDIDVPAEIMREHVAESTQYTKELNKFDPLKGNLLGGIVPANPHGGIHAYIAFPMGELKADLNLSPLHYLDNGGLLFKPSIHPVKTFPTPILQIVESRPSNSPGRHGLSGRDPFLAVRFHSQTAFFRSETGQNLRAMLRDLGAVSSSDVGGHAILDVKLNSELQTYTVNTQGTVSHGSCSRGYNNVSTIRQENDMTENVHHNFWRVGLGSNASECILASENSAYILDFRASTSLKLFTLGILNDVYTSLEDESSDGIIRFCTTNQLLWIDKRYPTKPLIGIKHGRNRDYTLQTNTVLFERNLTILTSRQNSLMTVYDASKMDDGPISIYDPPYYLLSSSTSGMRNCGQLLFRHPPQPINGPSTLFQLCERGSITCLDLFITPREGPDAVIEWTEEIRLMNAKEHTLREDIGPLGLRHKVEVDFSPVYEHLFHDREEQREETEEEAEAISEAVKQAPLFWQNADMSKENMLTARDIIFRAGEELQSSSNPDFANSIHNSMKVYRELAEGRLSPEVLAKGSAWHCDVSATLQHFIPEVTQDVQRLAGSLSQFGLNAEGGPVEWEGRAKKQLAVDMILASSVYAGRRPAGPMKVERDLESLTKALSLDNNALPIQLGHLRPEIGEVEDKCGAKAVAGSPGICQLLSEWTVGTNVRDRSPQEQTKTRPRTVDAEDTSTAIRLVRPPTILTSNTATPPLIHESTRRETSPIFYSQEVGESTRSTHSSQEAMASTQMVPGPYGGRPILGKKKPAKKRLGGF